MEINNGGCWWQWEELMCGADEYAEPVDNKGVYNGSGSSLGELMILFHGWSLLMKEKIPSEVKQLRTSPS